jgi:uncharacterized protein (DUF4415 family)
MDRPKPPANFDENPIWTDEMHDRARSAEEVHGLDFAMGMVRPRGRPALAAGEHKAKVNIRLSPDVLAALRATGAGWQTRVDQVLRKAFVK